MLAVQQTSGDRKMPNRGGEKKRKGKERGYAPCRFGEEGRRECELCLSVSDACGVERRARWMTAACTVVRYDQSLAGIGRWWQISNRHGGDDQHERERTCAPKKE